MWEAQLLSAAKGALPAIGFAIGGPGGAAVGAALASTIHVDAKTGKRSYQTTDETLVQAAVAAGLSQMGPGLTQSLVSASAAGMEYDANGKVTGKFNAGNAAIAFAGDYVGSKFNATHMSQYLARDITTQVLTVGTEYYNYSHGYENNYAAISNPDLSRLGALAGGLYMAGSRDSDEAKAQEIKNKGLAEGKTPKEIAAMMAAAGLEDIAKQIELGLQGKANEADQTQRMADIMRGLGIKTREDPFGNVALELGKFALGAVSFPIGIAGLLAMGTFGVAGETLGLLGKGAYSLGHGVGGTLGMIANTVGSVVGGVAGIGAGLLGGLAFGASLPIVLLASAMYGFGEAGVNLLSGDVDGAGRSLDNILGRVEAYGAAGSDFIKELIGGSIDLMGSMPDRNRMISEWMAAGFLEPWTHAQANKEAESQYIEYLLQHHGGTDAENHFAQRLLRDEGFDYVDGQGVWTAQKKMEDGRIMRIELTPDGKMNQIIQEGSPLGFGWLGLDSTYINGKRMENGDAFYRDVNMNLSVMQGGRKAIAAEMRKLGAHNYIGTQNGVWNTGLDAVGLNNFVRTQVAPGMDDYGGSFGVYNSSSFFGDVGHLALSLMLQSVGLSGTESAGETWKGIFDSGVFKDGGVIVAHSQGAQIVTHALQSWHGENTTLNTLEKTDLITLGGAHTIKPLDVVRSMYDMRNSPDKVTMFFHSQGDLVNRPNDQKYQRIFGPSSSPNDPANHTAVSSYDWALPTYLQRKRSLGELK